LTVVRPDITAGLPEKYLRTPGTLQIESGEVLPILKEALMKLTLWRRLLTKWVFISKIPEELILGLNVLSTHAAFVDLRRRIL
jgi:hypothetical protein